ncbi:uncharacterized protein (DUF305 family) [Saccharopolyspora erythraea NRRL 2338]|uniref:Uncharacterized protein n=2 Tax=Saccharopolyspora erythraea TaxID=1836 RepID=A4FN49_SACEN|nr:DUF305 domain-containing protein [Saccharopolyspora erythraea]EQD83053.1 hypothetical protein N599_27265 [Saccharopolyspora erythraea D]PFG99115.1 uncharacterized protein (DUF305 family) [Saccharopolyspora erythraea NRRL 2338]QRK89074.1 DUF305 domain-containing protein [Saccharopolyspora erythraea]CAM05474.1 hypothetical protein SACE_6302 [Saccharopolyspora erythraea NRRL 2338]
MGDRAGAAEDRANGGAADDRARVEDLPGGAEEDQLGRESSRRAGSPLAARIFIAVAGTVALLLLGAAGGMLLKAPSDQRVENNPSAVDVGFAQDMSVHHQQAVTMATLARERASDTAVRQLAFDIETNQRDQIGRMQGWLSLWGQPAQSTGAPMQWMEQDAGHGGGHAGGHGGEGHGAPPTSGGLMPGMATSAELARLQALRGPDFDVEFLRLMLRHHEGGAAMAEYGAQHAAVPTVRGLAQNMLGSQGNESMLMREMLSARGAAPLPPG